MIHYLEGKLTEKNPAYVVIDCNGIGYFVSVSLNTYAQIQDKVQIRLLTHYIVREDGHFLYGFAEESERHLFKLLISVSGVGANTARMILSALNPSELVEAITGNKVIILEKVKGIGQKTAQRIIIDLRDKLDKDNNIRENLYPSHNTIRQEALSALSQLGFNKMASEKVLDRIIKSPENPQTVEQLVREALKLL